MQSPTILTETESTVHLLKINGYSVTKALYGSDYISSGRLTAGGYDWEVRYYPSYYEYEEDEFWIALRLVFCSKGCTNDVKTSLKCRFVHETQSLPPSESKTVSYKYKSQEDCGPAVFLEKREHFSASEYLRGDSFVVECTITVLREPRGAVTNVYPSVADPCCDLHLHLGELLLSQKGADITLVVSGESFLAHKCILSARSPVFMAEFFGPMKESSSECVEIKDMVAPVFKAMLNFIYTDTLPELDQHCFGDMEQEVTTMAHHLLVAADSSACLRRRAHPPPPIAAADSGGLFLPSLPPGTDSRKMINLFKIKGQKKEEAANAKGGPPAKKQSPGELRLHKDIAELNLPKTTKISFPNGKDDLMNFEATLRPDEGYYVGGTFVFTFQVPSAYPHEPPKVKCKTKVYHPNIDLEGNVCLNILREDWKPVLNINTIIYGLNLLFTQPNDEDPLNHDAAAVLRDNPQKFQRNVQMAMSGGYVDNIHFPRCI